MKRSAPRWSASISPTASAPLTCGGVLGEVVEEVDEVEVVDQRVGDFHEEVREPFGRDHR